MPRFSVVVPCHNASRTLPETLASLAAQTFPDWEALCVDDGSTDATRAILEAEARRDPRVRPLRNPGKGPSAARNFGARLAQGQVLAFCDADDLWTPDKLAALDAAFADRALDGAYARIGFFDGAPDHVSTVSTPPEGRLALAHLMGENPVCTMSNIAVRRCAFDAAGPFREDMVHNEDLEWLIRLVGTGHRVEALDAVHVLYRKSPGGLSADLTAMARGRALAMASAARFGARPGRRAEAVHLRYLARRALRLEDGGLTALRLSLRGLAQSPRGFLSPLRRGGPTLLASLAAPVMPRALRRALFAR
ncbi:glycosyltransferase family 2 protein [Roseivivax isoporae]|uniref:Glucosyl transferase n=1 Tax=Roseivivax isoporae LMG 25204 TaxID=1449351 RepID=X7F818_9RHOB|nr:glycosyltransferase family 2 protein [Roseivivax isoporae]ETX28224.1 glucosyl transferase [Roseivivax isoporae LMG 25204]